MLSQQIKKRIAHLDHDFTATVGEDKADDEIPSSLQQRGSRSDMTGNMTEVPIAQDYNQGQEADFEEHWTTSRLIDETYLELMRAVRIHGTSSVKKYQDQAKYLMYKIPVYRPSPSFNVNVIDLTPKLRQELESLDDESLDSVMKEAIGRVFENINERYFLLSVKKLLKWELLE